MRMSITSAAGVLALLGEPEAEVKFFALKKLNDIVDVFWAEISEAVDKIEMLYEDVSFKHRNLAALVASKVYYHLGAFEESLTFALGADELFNVNDTSEYIETTIAKCIDHYTKLRVQNATAAEEDVVAIDQRLEAIVNRMFQRCLDDKQFKQAVGVALETRRIDIFEKAILHSENVAGMLSYTLKVCMSLIQNRMFRNTILRVLVKLYLQLPTSDFISVCQCLIFLDDAQAVAEILEKLLKGEQNSILIGYQIGFDLYESATQQFLQGVQAALRAVAPRPLATVKEEVADVKEDDKKDEGAMETDDKSAEVDKEKAEPKEIPVPAAVPLTEEEKALQDRITNLDGILGGDTTINMHLQFQIRTNKCDLQVLKNTKDAVRNSVCHNGTVIANGFMHAGTTSDQFLRDNLDWLSRATNWAKFTATASLGVIHKGHEKEALNLMATYLPKESGPGSAYSEGGGLYALGLIHANHGKAIMEYLLQQLKDATTDVVRHGGCLGLGLAAMGTAREDIYEQLKFNLFQDDAVTGEAAGLAMGLVMLGTKSASAIEDMVSYAQETQHEKILRGLAVGISLTMYGRLEEADALIDSLMHDKDPILRWSGMYTIAMAYCGTGSNKAIRKLLHIAVSDVNDDVRRAAVTSLGFLLFRTPEQCPSVVSLLSESYNPHVRYGAAMALGIACAGSGLKEAIGLLEPMVNDPVNYVRQGSLIASAMILVEHNEQTCSRMAHFRQLYAKVISDKHEDVMAKMGAILAQGIIDAGGRNMTMNLQSRTGHTNMAAVVGCLVFCQHWYWYPLSHFLALSFVPTTLIGLNSNLQMPKLEFRSNAKPSQYAYAPPLEEKKDKHKEKVETAVLSITAKAAKLKKKDSDKKKDDEKMEVDEDVPPEKEDKKDNKEQDEKVDEKKADDKKSEKEAEVKSEGNKKDANKKEGDQKDGDKKEGDKKEVDKKEKTPEPAFEMLANPARVMKAQLRVIRIPEACRYTTLKDVTHGGILMMTDTKPEEKEDIIEPVVAGGPQIDEEDEPEPPEPFEWTED